MRASKNKQRVLLPLPPLGCRYLCDSTALFSLKLYGTSDASNQAALLAGLNGSMCRK
jgi:hypothetical protein